MQTATFLIHDLCLYRDEALAIRQEVMNAEAASIANEPHSCVFPLLDSFIKESMRVNGSDAGKMKYVHLEVGRC